MISQISAVEYQHWICFKKIKTYQIQERQLNLMIEGYYNKLPLAY